MIETYLKYSKFISLGGAMLLCHAIFWEIGPQYLGCLVDEFVKFPTGETSALLNTRFEWF